MQEISWATEPKPAVSTDQSACAMLQQIESALTYMIRCAYTEQVPYVSEDVIQLRQKIRGLITVPQSAS
ncbi:hypothetical protein ABH944_002759 [Caballeronia udeis]|uniref:Uncharacterized protein n=1 Tax=Caballeronia udeis TaxID=1232866 RepID=A0ABW8MH60_9BURK